MIDGELCEKKLIDNIRKTKQSATSNKGQLFRSFNATQDITPDISVGTASGSLLPTVRFHINHVLPGAAFSSARLCSR